MTEWTAFLGLGTNLGDRVGNLQTACQKLSQHPHIKIIKSAPLYKTQALTLTQNTDTPWYLNSALWITTSLTAFDLFHAIKSIERDMGRTSTTKWDSRLIDIDILFYDKLILNDPCLTIPHPEIAKRQFVLTPLCDLAPYFVHPTLFESLSDLKSKCLDSLNIEFYSESWMTLT